MATHSSPSKSVGLAAIARSIAVDSALLGGAGLLTYGSWSIYPPAGFIVAGVVLLAAGLSGARR